MRFVKFGLGLLVTSLTITPPILAQTQQHPDARYYYQTAKKAYQEKNYPSLVENMKRALQLRPTHQTYMYYLAAGYALTGNRFEALSLLSQATEMGLTYDLENQSDFDLLRDT